MLVSALSFLLPLTCLQEGYETAESSEIASCVMLSTQGTLNLSIHFKVDSLQRFEHKSTDKSAARKIDTPIRFPAVLNMLEFTTVVAGMRDTDEAENATPGIHRIRCVWLTYLQFNVIHGYISDPGPETMYEYDLFAVINHEGHMNNGHYTNFARYCDEVSARSFS